MLDAKTLHKYKKEELMPGVFRWLETTLKRKIDDILSFNIIAALKLNGCTPQGWKQYIPTGTYPVTVVFADGSVEQRVFVSQELG